MPVTGMLKRLFVFFIFFQLLIYCPAVMAAYELDLGGGWNLISLPQQPDNTDFRMFQKKSNSDSFPVTCGSHRNQEIPKGEGPSIYFFIGGGESTYVPASCPAEGCD